MTAWVAESDTSASKYLEAVQTINTLCGPVEDVERMFTDLDLGQGAFRDFTEHQRRVLCGCIRRCLREFFVSIHRQNLPATLYANLGKGISFGDALITFNYDLALENELILARKFRVQNGYGFMADWKEPPSDVTVLKLHGSINWIGVLFGGARNGPLGVSFNGLGPRPFVDNADGALCEYPGRVLDASFPGGGVVDGATTLVLPTYEKQFFVRSSLGDEWSQFYASLWTRAEEFLANSDRIVIIGYSMPAADRRAATLLLSSRNQNADLYLCCASSNEGLAARFRKCGFESVHQSGAFADWLAQPSSAA